MLRPRWGKRELMAIGSPRWKLADSAGVILALVATVILVLVPDHALAREVTIDDWIDRLPVFYAVIAIIVVVDAVGLYFIVRALRRTPRGS